MIQFVGERGRHHGNLLPGFKILKARRLLVAEVELGRVAGQFPKPRSAALDSLGLPATGWRRVFDLALEGYGQGYAGQMTPFQMALLAATNWHLIR